MKIYEMKASLNGMYLLAAEFKSRIMIYNVAANVMIGTFLTQFEAGGDRMCISNTGEFFVAAAYSRYGLSLFDSKIGTELWNNKEIKHIQKVNFSLDDKKIYVINESNHLYEISVADGSILSKTNKSKLHFVNHYGDVILDSVGNIRWENKTVKTGEKIYQICRNKNSLFASVLGGGLRCYEEQGNLKWTANSKVNEQYIRLKNSDKEHILFALGYKYDSPRTEPFYFMDVYDEDDGKLICSAELDNSGAFVFINNSEEILSKEGTIYKLSKMKIENNGKKNLFEFDE